MTTASSYADFVGAETAWFKANPGRTFRYSLVTADLANQVMKGLKTLATSDSDQARDTLILSYRTTETTSGIGHSAVMMSPEETRTRLEMATSAEHDPDMFGMWMISFDIPIFPRPNRNNVRPTARFEAFLAELYLSMD